MSEQKTSGFHTSDNEMYPTLEQMTQYKEGTLSTEENALMDHAMAGNPFLVEAMEELDNLDIQEVTAITASVNQRVDKETGNRTMVLTIKPVLRYAAAAAVLAVVAGGSWMVVSNMNGGNQYLATTDNDTPIVEPVAFEASPAINKIDPNVEAELDHYEKLLKMESDHLASNKVSSTKNKENKSKRFEKPEESVVIAEVEIPAQNDDSKENLLPKVVKQMEPAVVAKGIVVAVIDKANPGSIGKYPNANQRVSKKMKGAPAFGDKEETNSGKITYEGDLAPQYPGGDAALTSFLKAQAQAQHNESGALLKGTVNVKFDVNAKGKVSKISIDKSTPKALAKEVERVVGLMPTWNAPSEGKGKVTYRLALTF